MSLPVILISAKSEAIASKIIAELIDNKLPNEDASNAGANVSPVWHIQNKYYTADVQLQTAPDGEPSPDTAPEGHIIYLTEDECTVEVASAREAAGADADVRVLAAECSQLPAALAAWAARKCLEPVPLREPVPEDEGEAEPRGMAAVRAALHAHAWPGLKRLGARHHSDSGSEEDVERAEQWVAALGALSGAARAVRQLPCPERRQAAEQLVAAFCRALGEDLDTL